MKLVIEKIKTSPLNALRRIGYSFMRKDERTGEMSFIKRVGREDYPRFHIYVKTGDKGEALVNLHIDQKKVSYGGHIAHSGEYEKENQWLIKEAEIVRREFEII